MAKKIKVAIAGVGNCASALVQGIQYYKSHVNGEKVANSQSDVSGSGSQNSSSLTDDDFNSMTESSIGLTSYDINQTINLPHLKHAMVIYIKYCFCGIKFFCKATNKLLK